MSLVDVEDEWTYTSWMSVSDVSEVGGVTLAKREWKKQGRKGRTTKKKIRPARQHAMEGTALINRKGRKFTPITAAALRGIS